MSRITRTISPVLRRPLRSGVFVVVAVLAIGALIGMGTGYTLPDNASAQVIVVTAPGPVVTTPVVPVVVTPVVTPPAPPVVTPPPATSNNSNNDDSSDDDGGGKEITVTADPDDPDSLPPCCTDITPPVATPPVVVAPPADTLPPCCTESTPPVIPPVDTLPPCCVITPPPVIIPPPVVTPPPVIVPPPVIPPPVTPPPSSTSGCIALTADKTTISSGDAVTLTWKVKNDKPVTITNTTDNKTVTTSNSQTGTVVVNPTKETTYHASVPSDTSNPHCTVTVKLKTTPPPVTTSGCVFLHSDKTTITSGDNVSLAWEVDNDKPVTITDVTHSKTVTTSNNETGTFTVNPTETTTYHASVPSDTDNPDCTVTVKVTHGGGGNSSSCILLSADKSEINDSGEDVVLTWKVKNDKPVTITDETHDKTITTSNEENGSVTVNPTEDTTYHASVPSDKDNSDCTVSINLDTGGGGGGGGGSHHHSGGSSKPDVYFSSNNRLAAPLASVYLSQIPYTGLDLGPVGTVVYWTLLVLWSLAAAYLVLFGIIPFLRRRLVAFGANVSDALAASPAAAPALAAAGAAHAMPATSVPAYTPYQAPAAAQLSNTHEAIHAAAVASAMPQVEKRAYTAPVASSPRMEMSGEGFKKFATAETLTIDDIVKGLSRESGMEFSAEPAPEPEESRASQPQQPSYEAPAAAPAPAPQAAAPATRAASAEAAPVHPDVVGFISSILEGERDVVFGTIRHLTQAGHDAEEFMAHAICAIDDAYRARIDGTPVHEDVKQVTDHCATSFLERLVTALTTAVDGSYSMGITGIKLALTRALAVAQG